MVQSLLEKVSVLLLAVCVAVYAEGVPYPPYVVGDTCPRTGEGAVRFDLDPFIAKDPMTQEDRPITVLRTFPLQLPGGLFLLFDMLLFIFLFVLSVGCLLGVLFEIQNSRTM